MLLQTFLEVSSQRTVFQRTRPIRAIAGFFISISTFAAAVDISFPDSSTIRFDAAENTAGYYILEESEDLSLFYGLAIELGSEAPLWDVIIDPLVAPKAFYRVQAPSLFAPNDTDGDGIDDVYELLRPEILDPLDPTDANLDPDNNGLTHLQEYLRSILGTDDPPQFYSREWSTFNFGAPTEAAISREYTTFNFGEPSANIEAISSEFSIYNGSGPQPYSAIPLSVSKEISLYNLGEPSAPVEAISKEISLYNGSGPPTYPSLPQNLSREISVFNFGAPSSPIEAISREVSVNALFVD